MRSVAYKPRSLDSAKRSFNKSFGNNVANLTCVVVLLNVVLREGTLVEEPPRALDEELANPEIDTPRFMPDAPRPKEAPNPLDPRPKVVFAEEVPSTLAERGAVVRVALYDEVQLDAEPKPVLVAESGFLTLVEYADLCVAVEESLTPKLCLAFGASASAEDASLEPATSFNVRFLREEGFESWISLGETERGKVTGSMGFAVAVGSVSKEYASESPA